MKKRLIITILFILAAGLTYAQDINSNGTARPHGITSSGLGTAITAEGNTFNITGGIQKGGNLFHSFGKFNLHSGENAVFHDAGMTNTIGRITCGEYSWINGKITSGAQNLYLLNPAGIMFGANASLDLTGSFHVTTSDYLKLGENDKFYAVPKENEILSIAAPNAFGFLDENIAAISVEGKGKIPESEWDGKSAGLIVSEGKTISVVGGDIELKNSTWVQTLETGELGYSNPNAEKPLGSLTAPGGQINIVSIISAGEVAIENVKLDYQESQIENFGDAPTGGNIALSGKSLIDVSGQGAGNIFIQCSKFISDDSAVYAKTFGNKDGGGIDIQADTICFENGSEINGNTYGSGKGGDVRLKSSGALTFSGADELKNASKIFLETHSSDENAGDTGILDISAKDIVFSDGAYISSGTFGSGSGGNLILRAENDISFGRVSFDPYLNYFLQFYLGDNPVNPGACFGGIFSLAQYFTSGNGGNIDMKADNIFFSDSASIVSMTQGSGDAGSISIRANDSVSLTGCIGPGWGGSINTSTGGDGNGGDILFEAGELTMKDGYDIAAAGCWEGKCGKTGDISIRVSGDILISGLSPYSDLSTVIGVSCGGSDGGNIFMEANSLTIENGAQITASTHADATGGSIDIHAADSVNIRGSSPKINYIDDTIRDAFSSIEARSYSLGTDSGNSGTVSIQAQHINISDSGIITTSSAGGGKAGDITLDAACLDLNENAVVSSESTLLENGGAAGTITVNADLVRLSGSSKITTEAVNTGSGEPTDGKITITAKDIVYLNTGEITTSVKGGDGKGGDIEIANPEMIVLNNSIIEANAFEGSGGNIRIVSGQFVQSINSTVEASSQKGIDGNINIESPDVNVTSGLTVMPGSFIDATKWQQTPCAQRSGASVSRFIFRRKDATPTPLDDWQGIK